jgi:hypothetical protein
MLRHVIIKHKESKMFPQQQQMGAIVPVGIPLRQVVANARQRTQQVKQETRITTQLEFQEFRMKLKFWPGIYVAHQYNEAPTQDARDISYCLYIENTLANIKQISSMGYPEACVMMPLVPPRSHPQGEIYFYQESGWHRRPITTEEFRNHINDSIQDHFTEVVAQLNKEGIQCIAPDRGWKGIDIAASNC